MFQCCVQINTVPFPLTLMYAHITKTDRKKITITNQNQRLTTARITINGLITHVTRTSLFLQKNGMRFPQFIVIISLKDSTTLLEFQALIVV